MKDLADILVGSKYKKGEQGTLIKSQQSATCDSGANTATISMVSQEINIAKDKLKPLNRELTETQSIMTFMESIEVLKSDMFTESCKEYGIKKASAQCSVHMGTC